LCITAKLAAKCSDGSIASHPQPGGVRAMSALPRPPIATGLMRHSETSLCATSRREQMHNIRLQKPDLLDHVLGAGKQRWRHFKAERLGGFEIDEQLDFCGLLDRQISRLFAPEQPGGVDANPTE